MTHEELISSFSEYHVFSKDDILKRISKFLESNVCIPKGKNRHPYADLIHAYAEGAKVEHNSHGWKDYTHAFSFDEYRIKPPEPVWEYQWCLMLKAKNEVTAYMASNNHLTNEEASAWISKNVNTAHFTPIKIEETKRERK